VIIDAHSHLGYSPHFYFPDISVEKMLKMMDSLYIEKSICSDLSLISGNIDSGLQNSIEAYQKSKGRILLYTIFNPNKKNNIKFVEKSLEIKGFVGVKIHPSFHQCYANDRRYEPLWELASSKNIPILTHTWDYSETNPVQKYSFPSLFEEFSKKYKKVNFILGHGGGRYNGHIAAVKLVKKHKNVYVDLAGDSYSLGIIKYFVDEIGSEKVLFGTDVTWIDPRTHIGRVLDADISLKDKKNIFKSNALRIFKKGVRS